MRPFTHRCSPHPTIETREARSDPQGILSVHGDKKYTKQGNLHPGQMALLLSYSIADFASHSGPSLSVGNMGSKAQAALIFGNDQINTINTTTGAFTISPLQNRVIADSYIRVLQSTTNVHTFPEIPNEHLTDQIADFSEWEIRNSIRSWTTVETSPGIQIFQE